MSHDTSYDGAWVWIGERLITIMTLKRIWAWLVSISATGCGEEGYWHIKGGLRALEGIGYVEMLYNPWDTGQKISIAAGLSNEKLLTTSH